MVNKAAVRTPGYERIKAFLIIFRWIAVILGLWMTHFGAKKYLINALPSFLMEYPIILVGMVFIYNAIASFLIFQYDDMKIFMGVAIFSDAIVGGFMSYYYGLPYFYLAILLPAMVATLYFDLLIAMVTGLICAIFYVMVIAVPLIRNIKEVPGGISQLTVFVFSSIAIYLGYLWSMRQELDVAVIVKKFNEEKNMLFEANQQTKQEFGELFNELEKREEMVAAYEEALEKATDEKAELMLTLENTQRNVENLRHAISDMEQSRQVATEEMSEEQEEKLASLKAHYESKMTTLDEEVHNYKKNIVELEDRLAEAEKQVVSRVGAHEGQVEDLQQKIGILVGKINQLNIALQSRENLFESFSKIIESPDLESTHLAVVNEAVKLVPSQTGVIFALEPTENGPMLFAEAAATPYKNLFVDYSVFPGDGPVGWVAKHKKPMYINNSEVRLKTGEELSTLLTYEKSALVVPMYYNEELMGVLYLGKPEKGAYSEKELYLMTSFCKLAGPSIYTARMYEKATQVTLVDETTGLYNETYFYQRLIEEVARSKRYNIPLTMVKIEVVNYERFAESSGKAVQDRLIRDLSEILRNHIRETDLAARLTDNEFAILFIHALKKDTIHTAERIRMSAEMRSFGTPQAKIARLFMAVGLSNMPDDAEDRDELYNLVNKCTEESKKRGGNQTVFIP